VHGIGQSIIKMSNYSAESYTKMFDQLLSEELCYEASAATEANIKRAIKLILGRTIKQNLIRGYSGLVLDESLNVHFTIVDATGDKFDLTLYYGA
jgi:hypothetical protein